MTDRDAVASWMQRYTIAWDSNEPAAIRDLFAPDGAYRFHPYDEPVIGHDAITAAWLDRSDGVGDHEFVWETLAVDGSTAVVQARTAYSDGDVYDNLWIIRLAEDGRAASFTEWFMQAPKA